MKPHNIGINFSLFLTLCTTILSPASFADPIADLPERPTFNRHIRPILSQNCYTCHGPDKNTRKADFRLDIADSAHELLAPGQVEQSEVLARIFNDDPNEVMPPSDAEQKLSEREKELIRRWVDQGAEYEPHWSLISPHRPEIPISTSGDPWVRTPVDTFVLRRLRENGLEPSTQADPVTLIRRVHFDLVGLPPSQQTLNLFAANPTQETYAQIVEQLLASPAYGERMAIDWLDQVRYADSNGYHSDEFRSMWPYRDYVINSFNANKAFDQFTIEQIAGDLLPNATLEQQVGASYNRLNQITAEGGAQAKEYLAMYAADRVRAVSSVWLGATMGCAECHDHKFDPYTAKDFYSLAAFFADIEEVGVYPGGSRWEPTLDLPTPEQVAEEARLQSAISENTGKLETSNTDLAAGQARWEAEIREQLLNANSDWTVLRPESLSTAHGAELQVLENDAVLAKGEVPAKETYTVTLRPSPGKLRGVRLETLMHPEIPNGLSPSGNFVLTEVELELHQGGIVEPLVIDRAQAEYEQTDHPITLAFDGNPETGWAVDGHIKKDKNQDRAAMFLFRNSVDVQVDARIVVRLRHESPYPGHIIGCFRLSTTDKMRPALNDRSGLPDDVYEAVRIFPELRSQDEAALLDAHYRSFAPELEPIRDEIKVLEESLLKLKEATPYVLATRSVEPREMRILPRGDWMDESGEVVQAATLESFPPLPEKEGGYTRLDLAQWLVSPENPATARVIMNRLWAQYFGTGLSKVLDDLGAQGEIPTHPDLLDWLAVEFRESGWDMKHMVRKIVLSSVYQQASHTSPELRERDPYNRLLARQSRLRLEAEVVRDNVLAISGLLTEKLGGPSVFPYQPDGYWDNCNTFRGPLIYIQSEGEDQYRRGLYTVWKRSFLHPSMLAFDAPTREECTAQRVVSNTPLQALTLLNDPTYFEAARALAVRALQECEGADGARAAWIFQQAVARVPTASETALLLELYVKQRSQYEENVALAQEALSVGFYDAPDTLPAADVAAWAAVARAVLNLHETVSRS